MSRSQKAYLQDIITAIDKIDIYVGELDLDEFITNQLVIDAVSMNLIVVGEAARNIPADIQQKYDDVEWRNIIRLRNVLTHEYFRRNLDRIWDIVKVALPELRQQVIAILQNEPDHSGE